MGCISNRQWVWGGGSWQSLLPECSPPVLTWSLLLANSPLPVLSAPEGMLFISHEDFFKILCSLPGLGRIAGWGSDGHCPWLGDEEGGGGWRLCYRHLVWLSLVVKSWWAGVLGRWELRCLCLCRPTQEDQTSASGPGCSLPFTLISQQTSGGENIEISACHSLGPQAKGSGTLLGWAELWPKWNFPELMVLGVMMTEFWSQGWKLG